MKQFMQVDVFGTKPYMGNPVAVVFDADKVSDNEMQSIARWTNLSETTFIQTATNDEADYLIRIFDTNTELPFAGHPSIGTAHAAIEAGLVESTATTIVQQCGAGLIRLTIEGEGSNRRIYVTGPKPILKSLPPQEEQELASSLRLSSNEASSPMIVDVGARWLTFELSTENEVRDRVPNLKAVTDVSEKYSLTGVTIYAISDREQYQVCLRAFAPTGWSVEEDPVCGSGNICVAAHLSHSGRLKIVGNQYVANQGRDMGRDGQVSVLVSEGGDEITVGGTAVTCISGQIEI